jgi:tetratricopeptide (TPR) repeat protein
LNIEPNIVLFQNFEAWNNLAKAYVKIGEKARAWKVLQESLKCNFENWQVWDNLMVVSIDCAEYQEVSNTGTELEVKHVNWNTCKMLCLPL